MQIFQLHKSRFRPDFFLPVLAAARLVRTQARLAAPCPHCPICSVPPLPPRPNRPASAASPEPPRLGQYRPALTASRRHRSGPPNLRHSALAANTGGEPRVRILPYNFCAYGRLRALSLIRHFRGSSKCTLLGGFQRHATESPLRGGRLPAPLFSSNCFGGWWNAHLGWATHPGAAAGPDPTSRRPIGGQFRGHEAPWGKSRTISLRNSQRRAHRY